MLLVGVRDQLPAGAEELSEIGGLVARDWKSRAVLRPVGSEASEYRHRARGGSPLESMQVTVPIGFDCEEVKDGPVVPNAVATLRFPSEDVGEQPGHPCGVGSQPRLGVAEPDLGDVAHPNATTLVLIGGAGDGIAYGPPGAKRYGDDASAGDNDCCSDLLISVSGPRVAGSENDLVLYRGQRHQRVVDSSACDVQPT